MIIHYNCTIGSFLLHSFLLIYHPYPPSFHEMIFTLVYNNKQEYVYKGSRHYIYIYFDMPGWPRVVMWTCASQNLLF